MAEADPDPKAEALWRLKLRMRARVDGWAAHENCICHTTEPRSRREILLPPGVADRLRGFLTDDPQG